MQVSVSGSESDWFVNISTFGNQYIQVLLYHIFFVTYWLTRVSMCRQSLLPENIWLKIQEVAVKMTRLLTLADLKEVFGPLNYDNNFMPLLSLEVSQWLFRWQESQHTTKFANSKILCKFLWVAVKATGLSTLAHLAISIYKYFYTTSF